MEFELEPKESYYLTYTDKIVAGDLLKTGVRGLVGSVVSGSNEYRLENSFGAYNYKKNNPFYNSSLLRGVHLINSNKVYQDSIMPDFSQIYSLNGGQFVAPRYDEVNWNDTFSNDPRFLFDSKILKMIICTGRITGSAGMGGVHIGDEKWIYEYPFMSKYKDIPRRLVVDNITNKTTVEEINDTDGLTYSILRYQESNPVSSSNKYCVSFVTGNNVSFHQKTYYDRKYSPTVFAVEEQSATIVKKNLSGLSSNDLLTCFFGFGVQPTSDWTYPSTFFDPQGTSEKAYGVLVDGWKYGVLSGIPVNPKAIYRRGKFGQLRDALEQRLYSGTLDKITNTKDNPVFAQFVSGTQAYLTASNTTLNVSDAGYYDFEYKCGRPYVEGANYAS